MPAYKGSVSIGPNLDRYTSAAEYVPGTTVETDGKCYRYVRFLDATPYAAGHLVTLASTDWGVTNDRSGGSDISLIPVGVCLGVPTQGQYGWVQVSGIADVLCTGAGIVAGDVLVASSSVDGAAAENSYGTVTHDTFSIAGVALEAISSGTTGKVLLSCGYC